MSSPGSKQASRKTKTPQEKEISYLKSQLQGFELLLQQNAELESEVTRLNTELDTATLSIVKRGYLHKWRDHEIGYASRWGLRYFSLQGHTLSYYGDESESRPRRTFDLSHCVVRAEGTKKNGQFHVISIYLARSDADEAEDPLDDSFADFNDDYSPAMALMVRVSTEKKAEAQQWLEMLEQGCAFTELTKGEPEIADMHDASGILGTIGTTKTSDTAPFIEDLPEPAGGDLSPVLLRRVRSSNLALQKSVSRQALARKVLEARGGEAYNDESCAPSSSSYSAVSKAKPGNLSIEIPSGNELRRRGNAKEVTSISGSGNNNKSDIVLAPSTPGGTKKRRPIKDFPAYKPMHTKSNWSPLSHERGQGEINYRGFFNLALIVFVLSNLRIIVDSHTKYGFLPAWKNILSATEGHSSLLDWALSKPGISLFSWCTQILIHWRLEKFYRYTNLSERSVLVINLVVGFLNIVIPCVWVWGSTAHWGGRMLYLFQSVIMWMKLISYAHANKDLRGNHKKTLQRKNSSENLLAGTGTNSGSGYDDNKKPLSSSQFTEVKDIKPPYLKYPQNLTLGNLIHFICVPSLTYQLNYPESPRTRWKHVFTIVFRMIIVSGLMLFGIEQYMKPAIMEAVIAVDNMDLTNILTTILKISVPNTYVWLLMFYFYFHLWLNLCAELTCFGDRQFYKDWWNARTIETYWRHWNLPVHNWMLRHLYYPMLRSGTGKLGATFVVFFFSAVAHEVILSLPFKRVGIHAFTGMLIQAPLTTFTKWVDRRYDNALFGNAIFWFTFCIFGQPLGMILISYDHWVAGKVALAV